MIEIPIPVSEFLDRSLAASVRSDYTAFLVIIARTAEGESLQDELLRHWESFDDLTNDQMLVISPKSGDDHYPAAVHHWRDPEGYVSNSLKFCCPNSREWDWKFWNSSPSQSSRRAPFYEEFGGEYAPRPPANEKDKKAAMTAAATDTARYFGIPESWLPCIVFLSLREDRLLVVSIDDAFCLYSFVRNVLIDIEPTTREIRQLTERVRDLNERVKSLERQIGETRRSLQNVNRRHVHVLASWEEQIGAICRFLAELRNHSSVCAFQASTMISILTEADEPTTNLDDLSRELLVSACPEIRWAA